MTKYFLVSNTVDHNGLVDVIREDFTETVTGSPCFTPIEVLEKFVAAFNHHLGEGTHWMEVENDDTTNS